MSGAAYFDGLSAARREARLRFEPEALAIADASGATVARWPYARLRSAERLAPGRLARLACADAPAARLHVADAAAVAELKRRAPQLARGGDELSWRGIALAAAVSAGALAGLYYGLPLAAGPVARAIPLEWEAALGEQVADGLSAAPACRSDAGWRALAAIIDPLARASGFEAGFRVNVVGDARNNAFAPGAHIVLFEGLLANAETPEEVAGVLAHEMGHAIERHATAGALRLVGLRALLGALFGDGGEFAAALAGAGGLLVQLSYSRDDERAADRIAGEILDRAGVSRQGLARFFARLAAEAEGSGLLDYVGTHPAPEERAAMFADAPPRAPILTPEQWAALKAICD